MNKKVLKPLALAATLGILVSVVSCQMPSQADHYKKSNIAKRITTYITFDVNYEANGGEGQMKTGSYTAGTELALPTAGFTAPAGFRFHSWNSEPDGTGSSYNAGETIIIQTDALTLYAIWVDKDALSINYYNTKGVPHNNPISFLESKSVQIAPLSIDYYTFDGWYTNSSYTGNPTTGWTPGTYSTDVSLWAKWTPITYTVSYDYDGGSLAQGEYNRTSFTVETNFTLKEPQKTGYTFDGWYDEQGNKITVLDANLAGQNLVLTARYNIITYSITYNLNGGTNAAENPDTYTVEDRIELVDATKTDRDLVGWYAAEDFTGNPITTIEKGTTGDIVLYAKWKVADAYSFDLGEEGIGALNTWINETISNLEPGQTIPIAISGYASTVDLHTISNAITTNSSHFYELDLSELNVTEFYNSGHGAGGSPFMDSLDNVRKIILPKTLKILSEGAFCFCQSLEEIIMNEGLTDIYWSAACECHKLKELTIPDSVEFIAQTAFSNCPELEYVHISKNSNLQIIGLSAFWNDKALKEIYIPPKVTYLDNRGAKTSRNGTASTTGSFNQCTALTTVTFSKTLTRINTGTFSGCNRITTINYEGTEEEWQALLPNIGTDNGSLLSATVNYNYEVP